MTPRMEIRIEKQIEDVIKKRLTELDLGRKHSSNNQISTHIPT